MNCITFFFTSVTELITFSLCFTLKGVEEEEEYQKVKLFILKTNIKFKFPQEGND